MSGYVDTFGRRFYEWDGSDYAWLAWSFVLYAAALAITVLLLTYIVDCARKWARGEDVWK